jgi:hypothetical protein
MKCRTALGCRALPATSSKDGADRRVCWLQGTTCRGIRNVPRLTIRRLAAVGLASLAEVHPGRIRDCRFTRDCPSRTLSLAPNLRGSARSRVVKGAITPETAVVGQRCRFGSTQCRSVRATWAPTMRRFCLQQATHVSERLLKPNTAAHGAKSKSARVGRVTPPTTAFMEDVAGTVPSAKS